MYSCARGDLSRCCTCLQSLLAELNMWLSEHGGPFIGGALPNTTDCYLVPKLNHALLSLKDQRGWEPPGGCAWQLLVCADSVHCWLAGWLCVSQ